MGKRRLSVTFYLRMRTLGQAFCAFACAALVYAGLFIASTRGGVRIDLTPDALGTLSEGTLQTLDALKEKGESVRLYLVFQEGTDSSLRQTLETIAQSYERAGNVTVETIDPVTQPARVNAFAASGQSVAEGSAIITNTDESRYALVAAREMYTYTVSSSGAYTRTGISAEQKITAAIRSVTGAQQTRVRFLTGHNEASSADCTMLVSRLEAENYEVDDFALLQGEALESGDVLIILSPTRDLIQEEYDAIASFLEGDGRILFACDATVDLTAMPLFEGLASRFSLTFEPGIVVEDERMADYWMNSPLYLMPRLNTECEVAALLKAQQRVIVPGARAVSGPEIPLSGYTYETILLTSDQAYVKRTDSEAFTREEGDPTGTQQLCTSVSHISEETQEEMRAVFLGTLYTAVDNSLLSSTYNLDLSLGLIGYLAEREDAVSVPVRAVTDTSMNVPSAAVAWRILAVTLCLPAATVIIGVIVLVRRRRR